MAISPPSDIVLDVARAADPARLQVAFDRLQRLGSGVAGTQFAAAVDEAAPTGSIPGLAGARDKFASLAPAKLDTAAGAVPSKSAKTLQQFEAQVISTFIEQMMPEATANTFGSGTAGGVWRSMLSEQIANQIAKAGGLGIREKVEAAIAARTNSGAPAAPDSAVAAARKLLDSKIAGANARDLAIPLSVEQRFLDLTKPAAAGGVVRSNFRQA
ncbi:rod-binding protein [Bosea sp. (in: a-proteobacteria)]|uniref:rod-binding protein n=1 Tax=Bosea sp. (in: a-proteobacteria) TaxID=1871050 RepID=UPI0027345134|nr:rod-binding protein [Bosea sp. (in: a-proteobacteria)]MDP3408763.1 rod-binding protein [Bosea sp. (in: a-proteobacteria)]